MVKVIPLSVHIGAQIEDVDISKPLQPKEVQDIRSALLKWKVIFFRGQSLDHQKQIDFAHNFGALTPGHVVFGGDDKYPEIYSVAKFRAANSNASRPTLRPWSGWHTDITAAINPPAASILRGDIVPPYGGDTQWTNLAAAYNALSPVLQYFLEGLKGRHSFPKKYGEFVNKNMIISNHPLVRVHPETGERVLYISPGFLKAIVGLAPQESVKILEMLWEHAVRPEFTVRFKWEPGSVAFWDNRSTA
ncbi:MAG: TauD/TfdA dioxygenase family protein, partial [Candidatus Azotimanducaceae bacterium]